MLLGARVHYPGPLDLAGGGLGAAKQGACSAVECLSEASSNRLAAAGVTVHGLGTYVCCCCCHCAMCTCLTYLARLITNHSRLVFVNLLLLLFHFIPQAYLKKQEVTCGSSKVITIAEACCSERS